jgi:hypothetical protein
MEIYINEQKLETTLNGETYLGQVFDEILKWIETNHKYLRSYNVNGEELSRTAMENIEIVTVSRLDLFVGEELDIIEDSLIELDSYVDKVGSTLVGRDSLTEKETNDLKEGIPWIENMLVSTKNLLHLNLASIRPMGKGKNVEEIIASLKEVSENLDGTAAIDLFLEDLRDLKLFLMDLSARLAVIRMEDSELLAIIQKFVDEKDKIIKDFMLINENFQSGKDHLATEIMTDAVGRLNALISAMVSIQGRHTEIDWAHFKAGEMALSKVTTALNDSLGNVAEAMEKNDIVYAGDILEYELPELLENMIPLLKEILSAVQAEA